LFAFHFLQIYAEPMMPPRGGGRGQDAVTTLGQLIKRRHTPLKGSTPTPHTQPIRLHGCAGMRQISIIIEGYYINKPNSLPLFPLSTHRPTSTSPFPTLFIFMCVVTTDSRCVGRERERGSVR